jgi:hypothetical protein
MRVAGETERGQSDPRADRRLLNAPVAAAQLFLREFPSNIKQLDRSVGEVAERMCFSQRVKVRRAADPPLARGSAERDPQVIHIAFDLKRQHADMKREARFDVVRGPRAAPVPTHPSGHAHERRS